jgi:hypothetical protein
MRIPQRAGQFKQEVAIHFSSRAFREVFCRGKAAVVSDSPIIWFTPITAPANADNLRNVLLFNFTLFCFVSFERDGHLFFIAFSSKI